MMRVCLTWRCPNKIPIVPGRKTPSRCAQCRGRSWSNPPPANAYAYGSGWQAARKRVLERDRYQCQLRYADICVGRASQVDHIVQPEAGGGSDPLTSAPCACGAMPGAYVAKERWPSSALPSGGRSDRHRPSGEEEGLLTFVECVERSRRRPARDRRCEVQHEDVEWVIKVPAPVRRPVWGSRRRAGRECEEGCAARPSPSP
jgi:hypothetical protein